MTRWEAALAKMTKDDLEMSNIVVSRGTWLQVWWRLWKVESSLELYNGLGSVPCFHHFHRNPINNGNAHRDKINKQVLSSINTISHRTEQINKP